MKAKLLVIACALLGNSFAIGHVYYKDVTTSVYCKNVSTCYRQSHLLIMQNNKHPCCGGTTCPRKENIFANIGEGDFDPLCCHHPTTYCVR